MLGIEIAKSTVEKYRPRLRRPPSPLWRTFLQQHMRDTAAIDLFTVPTVRLRVLFVLIVLSHVRRKIFHFDVTEHPTAEWTSQQLVEAFPWEPPPKYLLRDRDAIYGSHFRKCVRAVSEQNILSRERTFPSFRRCKIPSVISTLHNYRDALFISELF
jgi:putative transposase